MAILFASFRVNMYACEYTVCGGDEKGGKSPLQSVNSLMKFYTAFQIT